MITAQLQRHAVGAQPALGKWLKPCPPWTPYSWCQKSRPLCIPHVMCGGRWAEWIIHEYPWTFWSPADLGSDVFWSIAAIITTCPQLVVGYHSTARAKGESD